VNGHWALLLAAVALAIGMVVMAVLVLRAEEQKKRVAARLSVVSHSDAQRLRPISLSIARAAVSNRLTTRQRIAAQFGFDPDRTAHYRVRPWIVLLLALIGARGLTMLISGVFGSLALLATPVVWVVLCRSTFSTMDDRFTRVLVKQFPDALAMIVRSVRVGIPVSEAIRVVSLEAQEPTAGEFAKLAGELAIGATIEDAIKSMAERTGLAEYRFFATTITLQSTAGGSLSETLEGLADVIRRRLALRAKGMAMASEARASAVVLIALPFVTGGGMYLLNEAYIGVLFKDPLGQKMLGLACASLIVGVLIMRSLIRRSLA
jgi:tight adherence protein B